MIRSKIWDEKDLARVDFARANNLFSAHFGPDWPPVPVKRWEYCAASVFSEVVFCSGKALDVGCGNSIFPHFLNRVGCDVYAIDRGIRNRDEKGVHYRNKSMTDLSDFEDGIFDYVFAISSLEHVNAGRFVIDGMNFDTGDSRAILELCRVLAPGGKLVVTTDFAKRYCPPPGLWPSGSHRIYDLDSLYTRLIIPAFSIHPVKFHGKCEFEFKDNVDIKKMEPAGYDYTSIILTIIKE